MIVSKSSLEAARLASPDKAVPILNNVCIRADGTIIAANGKSMVFVSPVEKSVRERVPLKETELLDELVLSTETVNELVRAIPKDTMFKGMLEHAEIAETGTEGEVLVRTTDGKRHKDIRCKTYGRKFVDVEKLLGDVLGSKHLGGADVNLSRFKAVLDTLCKICPDGSGEVPLFIDVYEKATVLRTFNMKSGQRAVAVVYNYRPDTAWWIKETDWEKALLQKAPTVDVPNVKPARGSFEATPGAPTAQAARAFDVQAPKRSFKKRLDNTHHK